MLVRPKGAYVHGFLNINIVFSKLRAKVLLLFEGKSDEIIFKSFSHQ